MGIAKRFRNTEALRGLDLTVPEDAFYLLVGPNGAGKTTALRVLLDLVRPDEGTARVFGMDCQRQGPEVRAGIGYVSEGPIRGYDWIRVERLFQHHAVYYPAWDPQYAAHLVEELEVDVQARYGKLSKGQGRRVQLILALAHRPRLLLLDEPMDGLDPVVRDRVAGLLAEHLAEYPTTVLASTHHIQELERLADHIGILRDGRLIAQTDRETLDGNLKQYRLEVPADWAGVPALAEAVLSHNGSEREQVWTIWGDPAEVERTLGAAGATVRDTSAPPLEQAAVALLTGPSRSGRDAGAGASTNTSDPTRARNAGGPDAA
jgi:ABC-2 type transport system ATP-binding protein